eukprot:scaffold1929_cov376-Prasinococcus_capsulatus_cf.AAC.8
MSRAVGSVTAIAPRRRPPLWTVTDGRAQRSTSSSTPRDAGTATILQLRSGSSVLLAARSAERHPLPSTRVGPPRKPGVQRAAPAPLGRAEARRAPLADVPGVRGGASHAPTEEGRARVHPLPACAGNMADHVRSFLATLQQTMDKPRLSLVLSHALDCTRAESNRKSSPDHHRVSAQPELPRQLGQPKLCASGPERRSNHNSNRTRPRFSA